MTEAELDALDREYARTDHAPFQWAPTQDCRRLLADVRRLRQVVKAAYMEGVEDAGYVAVACWRESEAHAALDGGA